MNKKAVDMGMVLRALAGVGIGGALGYHVTPRVGGYEDVPSARRSAALMHALTGGFVGALGPSAGKALKTMDPVKKLQMGAGVGAGLLAEEALPMGLATMKRQQESAAQQGSNTIPAALQRLLGSSGARGAGAGAAIAGLGGIVSGLGRRQSDKEFKDRTGRGTMIAKDTLKYLIPAMLAGGIIGGIHKPKEE